MAAARCQVLLTLTERHQRRRVFDPSSPKDLFLPSQGNGQEMSALVLHGVCKSWTSSHSPADFWLRYLCSDCFSLLHAAQVRAGTLVAHSASLRSTSSTVMLHQVAGLFVHASPCTQRWPSTPHLPSSPIEPVVITLGVFDDPVMDSSRVVLWLHPSSFGQSLLELFETSATSVAVALHGNLKQHQLFGAEPPSLLPRHHLSFNSDASFSLCAAAH